MMCWRCAHDCLGFGAVPGFFPESAGHRILPLLASVAFDPTLLAYLSRQRIHALGFGDETMELLNEGYF